MELSKIPEFIKENESWGTLLGKVGETKFSIFYYKYPLIKPTIPFEGIQLACKEDIAAMKINAFEDRGTKRDFIDVYFLAKEFTLDEMFGFYDEKYNCLDDHLYGVIRSLSYFEDADHEVIEPTMLLKVDWKNVKKFFESESKRLAKRHRIV